MTVDIEALRSALADLESAFSRVGAPPLPPGLDPATLASLTAHLPAQLPVELAELFGRHDGFGASVLPIPHAPMSLRLVLQQSRARRAEAEAAANSGLEWNPDEVWPHSWLQLGSSNGLGLVVDCNVPYGESSPVLSPDLTVLADPEAEYAPMVEPSVTALIGNWVQLFDLGVYGWDAATQAPVHRYEMLPDDLRGKGIY